jgi:hypothetical protein
MSSYKLALLSLFAVFAFGAAAPSSAMAACNDGGARSVFCFDSGTEIHEELVLGIIGLSLLIPVIGSTTIKIHCKDGIFHGKTLLLGTGTGTIQLLNCTVEKPASCTVIEPIVANVNSTLSEGAMPATGTLTGAGANEKYTEISLIGASCSVQGTFELAGSQLVEFPEGETSKVNHEIVAKKIRSHLKFAGNTAGFSGTFEVHLGSGLPWLIDLGS